MKTNRREFLEFMGRAAALGAAAQFLPACVSAGKSSSPALGWTPLRHSGRDALEVASGLKADLLLRWRQPLNNKGERFGYNNDYLAFFPLEQDNEALLWVNHEYHDPYYTSGWRPGSKRTREQAEIERKEVGGSINHLRRSSEGQWSLVENSNYNRRLDAFTKIPFSGGRKILGQGQAIGTFGNCAGGVTPWGTVLTCEENYQIFVGDVSYESGKRQVLAPRKGDLYLAWVHAVQLPPEHYGWVVEVEPRTGQAKKHLGLGRMAHECATCIVAADGRTVVYTGDDAEDEHLYKFISAKPGSLEEGELFVADLSQGRWVSLAVNSDPRLKATFKDQIDLLIQTRRAAKMVGATPLDRPEDIEIDPIAGGVYVTLTNNRKKGNLFGSILKIQEKNRDPLSLEFESETFVAGGTDTGFACPDNLVFDKKGNLWMTTDMSSSVMKRGPYKDFQNNGLFYIPLAGPDAGRAFQVASAPNGAELTGPCFSADGKTLFLSVQHPGEDGYEVAEVKSHWPDGGEADPAPCVVALQGPLLEKLTS